MNGDEMETDFQVDNCDSNEAEQSVNLLSIFYQVKLVCDDLVAQVELADAHDKLRLLDRAHRLALNQLATLHERNIVMADLISPWLDQANVLQTFATEVQTLAKNAAKGARVESLETELEKAYQRNEDLATELAAEKAENASLQRKVETLENELKQQAKPNSNRIQLHGTETNAEAVQELHDDISVETTSANADRVTAFIANRNSVTSPTTWLKSKIRKHSNSSKDQHVQGMQDERAAALQAKVEDYEANVRALQSTKTLLLDKLKDAERALAVAIDQRNQARAQNASDREVIQYLDIRSQELEAECQASKSALEAKNKHMEQLNEKLRLVQNQLTAMNVKHEEDMNNLASQHKLEKKLLVQEIKSLRKQMVSTK